MSDELRIPPVIDLEVLLQPISEESPSGESLRYSGIYDEIAEARRADDGLDQGEWKTDQKVADFGKVIDLCLPALSTQSKDLQIAVWVSEAISRKYGFAGFRDALLMLAGLQEKFWDTLHPEIDEGDMEGRANAISWLDVQFPLAIKAAPITPVSSYTFNDWEDAKKFDFPDNLDALSSEEQAPLFVLKAQAEKEHRVTSEMWNREKAQTRRDAVERVNFVIEECWAALADLNRIIEEKYDRKQMPGLSNLKKTLEDIHTRLKLLLEEKRLEEPDPVDEVDESAEGRRRKYGQRRKGRRFGGWGNQQPKGSAKAFGRNCGFLSKDRAAQPGFIPRAASRKVGQHGARNMAAGSYQG